MLLIAAALLMKLLVPSGYMPTQQNNTLVVSLCTGYGPATTTIEIPIGSDSEHQQTPDGKGTNNMVCAFASVAGSELAATDAILLGNAIAFTFLAALFIAPEPWFKQPAYLRPPLRGPPARA